MRKTVLKMSSISLNHTIKTTEYMKNKELKMRDTIFIDWSTQFCEGYSHSS